MQQEHELAETLAQAYMEIEMNLTDAQPADKLVAYPSYAKVSVA